jgi:cell division protein FtsL
MKFLGFFDQRVRGFRIIDLGGIGVLLVLVLVVYLSKAGAGGERNDIDRVSQLIYEEQTRIRLLQAEVANLEQPERLAALSGQYLGLQPVSAKHEVQAEALPDLALIQKAKTTVPAAPSAAAGPAPAAMVAPTTAPSDASHPKDDR